MPDGSRPGTPVCSVRGMADPIKQPPPEPDRFAALLREHADRSLRNAASACADALALGMPIQARISAKQSFEKELDLRFRAAYEEVRRRGGSAPA